MTLQGVHQHKAHMQLAGKTFLAHVEQRLLPQVNCLIISCNIPGFTSQWPVVLDTEQATSATIGPLAGIVAGLSWLQQFNQQKSLNECIEWMQICPIDAPLVPSDLCEQLWLGALATHTDTRLILPLDNQLKPQPLFSLIHVSVLPDLAEFLKKDERSFLKFASGFKATKQVAIKEGGQGRLLNINTEQELIALEL